MTEVMTTKKTKKQKAPALISAELLDQLIAQVENKNAESILGETGLAGQLKKLLAERMLTAELNHHLANEEGMGNHRNGSSQEDRAGAWWRDAAQYAESSRSRAASIRCARSACAKRPARNGCCPATPTSRPATRT